MRKREAIKEAHGQAAAAIRQYAEQQGGLLGDDEVEDEKIRAALHELADRHDAAVRRMDSGQQPTDLPGVVPVCVEPCREPEHCIVHAPGDRP